MTTYTLDDAELAALRGKTVLIIGAASGIGREAVKLAHSNGANVAFGDWNEQEGRALAAELKDRALFRKCDVSAWPDVLALFAAAFEAFGALDAVVSNAGINREDLLRDEVNPATGALLPPDLKLLDVNLTGMCYAVKCAVHYFRKQGEGGGEGGGKTRSIVLTGSAASFLDTPPLHLYCASKAGVLGLMRSLRTGLVREGMTINMVAPWMTHTQMTRDLGPVWQGLPANEPAGVARALLLPAVRPAVNGKSFFVAGNAIVEFEDKIQETQPLWMGAELSAHVDEGQRRLIPGDAPWTANA